MKDLPHHIKKLNRQIVRSTRRIEAQEALPDVPNWPDSDRQKRKKAKLRRRHGVIGQHPSEEERNQIQKKGRVPIFDRNNAPPKHAKPSPKKTSWRI
jgi:hypothetical protein